MAYDPPMLYDADTAERLGPATIEQVVASNAAAKHDGGAGFFRIDQAGSPSPSGRRVYTSRSCTDELHALNERWLTVGELRGFLEQFTGDVPITVAVETGCGWLNVIGATNPYATEESSIILMTRDDFDTRQW